MGLPWNRPDLADRFLSEYPPLDSAPWLTPVVTWKIATQNPERARQLVDARTKKPLYIEHEFCLALGAKLRNEAISSAALEAGLRALDLEITRSPQTVMRSGGRLLAIAEAIDPALLPEVMWYSIAARPPSKRVIEAKAPGPLVRRVACYDRDLAAALLHGRLERMQNVADRELVDWDLAFETWAAIDPLRRGRAARARADDKR